MVPYCDRRADHRGRCGRLHPACQAEKGLEAKTPESSIAGLGNVKRPATDAAIGRHALAAHEAIDDLALLDHRHAVRVGRGDVEALAIKAESIGMMLFWKFDCRAGFTQPHHSAGERLRPPQL